MSVDLSLKPRSQVRHRLFVIAMFQWHPCPVKSRMTDQGSPWHRPTVDLHMILGDVGAPPVAPLGGYVTALRACTSSCQLLIVLSCLAPRRGGRCSSPSLHIDAGVILSDSRPGPPCSTILSWWLTSWLFGYRFAPESGPFPFLHQIARLKFPLFAMNPQWPMTSPPAYRTGGSSASLRW